jgi:hypothetical protein
MGDVDGMRDPHRRHHRCVDQRLEVAFERGPVNLQREDSAVGTGPFDDDVTDGPEHRGLARVGDEPAIALLERDVSGHHKIDVIRPDLTGAHRHVGAVDDVAEHERSELQELETRIQLAGWPHKIEAVGVEVRLDRQPRHLEIGGAEG